MMRTAIAFSVAVLAALAFAPAAAATAPGHNGRIVFASIRTGSYEPTRSARREVGCGS